MYSLLNSGKTERTKECPAECLTLLKEIQRKNRKNEFDDIDDGLVIKRRILITIMMDVVIMIMTRGGPLV